MNRPRRGTRTLLAAVLTGLLALFLVATWAAPADAATVGYTFDTTAEGFTTSSPTVVARSTDTPRTGAGILRISKTASGGTEFALGPSVPVTAGTAVTVTGYVRATVAGNTSPYRGIQLLGLNSAGSAVETSGVGVPSTTTANTWAAATTTFTPAAGTVAVQVRLFHGGATSTVVDWDDVTVTGANATATATPTPTPTPTPTATATPTPSTTPVATPTPSPSGTATAQSGTVTLDSTQYGQLFALLFGFCSLSLVLQAVTAGRNQQ